MAPTFVKTLETTYYRQGFFNVPVDYARYFKSHITKLLIELPDPTDPVDCKINHTANQNGTPRIMGGVPLRDWFHSHFDVGDTVEVEILAPDRIRISGLQHKSEGTIPTRQEAAKYQSQPSPKKRVLPDALKRLGVKAMKKLAQEGRQSAEHLTLSVEYHWEPFMVDGADFCFKQHRNTRLPEHRCNHWGPAIYKWEGQLQEGPHRGLRGVLIGETGDLRQRIKQYVAGTQKHGNKKWREHFLQLGEIHLWVLRLEGCELQGTTLTDKEVFQSNSLRRALEELLVSRELREPNRIKTWVVNKRQ